MLEDHITTELVINGRFLTQPVTGVQRYAREVLTALDQLLAGEHGLKVRLLTPSMPATAVPRLHHIRHEIVGRRQGHWWEQVELPRHVAGGVLFCPGNTAPVASLFGPGRVVVTIHDLSYLYFPEAYSRTFRLFYNGLIPYILRRADRVITVSRSEQDAIIAHYPFAAGRLTAIQNGGLPVGIDEQQAITATEPSVLYVGSLSRRKNFPNMLQAAIRLARSRAVRFDFVGSVPPGLTASLTDIPNDVAGLIRFHGQVNDWGTLLHAYRSSDCLLFPSLYEASPLPPIEAMGCGCPVVAGDIPSLRERCGDAALYCDPADVDQIVAAVERVLDEPALRTSLRQAGYERARRYSWRSCAQSTLAAILGYGDG